MKNKRIIWVVMLLIMMSILVIAFGSLDSVSQQNTLAQSQSTPTPDIQEFEDLGKYIIAEFDAPEPTDRNERKERKKRNRRYDGADWVRKNPHPETGGIGRYDEETPPPIVPVAESNLVVSGEILNARAYVSNDKGGVYTEFTVCVNEVFKPDPSNRIQTGTCITVDREGGFIRYPNGQKILYRNSAKDLPRVGQQYALFLSTDGKSPNYEILTGYELKDDQTIPLDSGRNFDEYINKGKVFFVNALRNKVSRAQKID